VVFDKTGTLTEGRFGVQGIVTFADASENDVLQLAASLEAASEHPIGEGIVVEAKRRSLELRKYSDFEAMKGRGVGGIIDGGNILVVSPGYLEEKSIQWDEASLKEHYSHGRTVVFVLQDKKLLGAIALGDTIRPESKGAIEALHNIGIKCIMLTGDRREVAEVVASNLGLDEYFAEVLPDLKAAKIRELMDRGMRVAMTGDGVNDAPALATADVGIAIGAGTDVAIETADIILVRSNPRDVVAVFRLAKATYGKMVQNLIWATGYNVVAIPLAAGVLASRGVVLSPAIGAVLMSLSTVIVAINAKFLALRQ
jgi:Cu2+-exporting ATPase